MPADKAGETIIVTNPWLKLTNPWLKLTGPAFALFTEFGKVLIKCFDWAKTFFFYQVCNPFAWDTGTGINHCQHYNVDVAQ